MNQSTSNTLFQIAKSWTISEGICSTSDILEWVRHRNETVAVEIYKNALEDSNFWFYDLEEGCIRNKNRSFFTINGFVKKQTDGRSISQPIILQPEIGYLGIICKQINGAMHFLMQAKIEPGNVNKIQISPTIQATKSNFTQKHGGAKPPYLDYFVNAGKYEIVVDQIQSEQSSRFLRKRNRNILIHVDEEIDLLPSHQWMTLGQLKHLMKEENLVNMDTRTVLSCIPYSQMVLTPEEADELQSAFHDTALYRSVFAGDTGNMLPQIYQYINNYKMFSDNTHQLVPLFSLDDWHMQDQEFVCRHPYPFKVVFCDIAIEGREVKRWTQPLFEAVGIATFGLICCEENGILKFLVRAMPEVGCFDELELGPSVQREAVALSQEEDAISHFFFQKLKEGKDVVFDHLLSEEGGRFYHEQNRNVLLRVQKEELPDLPDGYFLLDYKTLNTLVQVNNTLNIQLRNLLSLLEA